MTAARRLVFPLCLLVGPLLVIVAGTLHPDLAGDGAAQLAAIAQCSAWRAIHWTFLFSFPLALTGLVGLWCAWRGCSLWAVLWCGGRRFGWRGGGPRGAWTRLPGRFRWPRGGCGRPGSRGGGGAGGEVHSGGLSGRRPARSPGGRDPH